MHQPADKLLMFRNRLEKVYKHRSKIARRQVVSCYRVYDHDLPEFPLLIECYEGRVYIAEYKRKHSLSESEYENWWEGCKQIIAGVTGIKEEYFYFKLRKRKENRQDQYQKVNEEKNEFIIHENGLQFIVNLSDYLDTGLFLDHRITRQMVKEEAKDKRVLNLFCYTGSFSVYAAAGGAQKVVSVDLSNTYLNWAGRNMQLNFPHVQNHELLHADVLSFLKEAPAGSFDLIVMDPPTFSNSKRMEDILDIQRDHVFLINEALRLLQPGGRLYFSTNFSKFILNREELHSQNVKDITGPTTPFDFANKLKRYCYLIGKERNSS